MTTAGVVGAAGDVAAQALEHYHGPEGTGPTDVWRTARLVLYRAAQAPIVDVMWRRFDVWYAGLSPLRAVGMKVISDQALLMPPSMCIFFGSQALLEGHSPEGAVRRITEAAGPALVFQLPFWIGVHSVTFGLCPPQYRVLWVSCSAVLSNMYLSLTNRKAATEGFDKRRTTTPLDVVLNPAAVQGTADMQSGSSRDKAAAGPRPTEK